ncbi:hypothetical protein [Haloarchaeobius sp. DFWS5]|uniref:hypothetical protein n=1 Tax=Haloarchaeobius sp. DFWS5 TaxID=3446114 RepID=UPI003EC11331
MRTDRRSLLRLGGAGVLATLGVGVAGYFGGDTTRSVLGGGEDDGFTLPETGDPTYRQWLPDPTELPTRDGEPDHRYLFNVLNTTSLREHEQSLPGSGDRLGAGLRGFSRMGRFHLGLSFDDIDAVTTIGMGPITVVEGSYDTDSVRKTLETTGFERRDRYGGYEFYTHQMGVAALAADAVLTSTDSHAPRRNLETVIDAQRGEIPRYHEVNEDFRFLTDTIGSPTLATVWTSDPEADRSGSDGPRGVAGQGHIISHGDDAAYQSRIVRFQTGETVNRDRVVAAIQRGIDHSQYSKSRLLGTSQPLQPARPGRLVRFDGEIPYDRYADVFGGPDDELTPVATWRCDLDREAETVTIHHVAGDDVPADRLTVMTNGGPSETQFADEFQTVSAGTSLTVPYNVATAYQQVRVVWESAAGRQTSILVSQSY